MTTGDTDPTTRWARMRTRVRDFLNATSRNRDLILATIPLWAITIAGVAIGFLTLARLSDQQERDQACATARTLDHLYDQVDILAPGADWMIALRKDLAENYPDPDTC